MKNTPLPSLTPRQQQIFDIIVHYIDSKGYPPSRAEIVEECGFQSWNSAQEHLKALAAKGVITLIPNIARGIIVKDKKL